MGEGEAVGKKKNNQALIKIICVIASFILWIYVANIENPERTDTLLVPVSIENVDALADYKLVLMNDRKFEVKLKVKGPMLDINALNASKIKLKVDMSSVLMLKKGINRVPVIIDSIPDNITAPEKDNLKLEINLDELKSKTVPVQLEIPASVKPGYAALDPVANLSSVYISGPAQYVDNVAYVKAKSELKDGDADAEFNLPLQPYDEAGRIVKEVKIDPGTVNVVIPVKKTKTVSIFINTKGNITKGMKLNSIEAVPAKVDIAGDPNVLKAISQIETETIDLAAVTTSKTIEAKLNLPNNVVLVHGNPVVNVKINVDQVGQKNISRSVQFINLGQGLNYTADKNSVFLVLTGPQSLLNAIGDNDIKCTADLTNLGEGENHSVPVTVSGLPDGLVVESKTPTNVKVTITKVVTVAPTQSVSPQTQIQ